MFKSVPSSAFGVVHWKCINFRMMFVGFFQNKLKGEIGLNHLIWVMHVYHIDSHSMSLGIVHNQSRFKKGLLTEKSTARLNILPSCNEFYIRKYISRCFGNRHRNGYARTRQLIFLFYEYILYIRKCYKNLQCNTKCIYSLFILDSYSNTKSEVSRFPGDNTRRFCIFL